jgi:pSer/pThr/pTyr-binding forkhead associated (FHA) protein
MPKLIMTTAAGESRQVELRADQSTIGRGAQNDIVVDSIQASRVHALIDVERAFVTIRDLGSRNGTFVNDVRIESQVLAEGDVIRLGSYEMRFKAGDQEFSQVEAFQLPSVPGLWVDYDLGDQPTAPGFPITQNGKF